MLPPYILIKNDASAKYKYIKEYKGKARSSNYIEEIYNHTNGSYKEVKGSAFLSISYRDEKRGVRSSSSFDCLEINGILFLGKRYETGDIDAGNLKKYHLLYKKVK